MYKIACQHRGKSYDVFHFWYKCSFVGDNQGLPISNKCSVLECYKKIKECDILNTMLFSCKQQEL